MAAELIVGSLIGAVTGYLESKAKSKEAKAQAQQFKNNITILQSEIERGEVEMAEALQRIDSMIKNTKGEIRGIMEKQVDIATREVKDQYRTALTEAMAGIRSDLQQRRLLGSEAGVTARRKTATGLQEQAGEQTTRLRERALTEISRQMAALEKEGFGRKEGERKEFKQFRLGALGEIMQLGNMASSLERQADVSPFLGAFKGAAGGGLGKLVGSFFTPGQELRETGTGEAFSSIPKKE